MNATVERALLHWGMAGCPFRLIAARENQVFRVVHRNCAYALRLHRKHYRTDDELRSELQWMEAVANAGLNVPAPVPSASGANLQIVDGRQVDMLTWLDGEPVSASGRMLEGSGRAGLFRMIGREMARLHDASDAWQPPPGFTRCDWSRTGLLGDRPLWGRFWMNPTLSAADRRLFERVRVAANDKLAGIEAQLDHGLIHADLVRENVLVNGDSIHLIDFDDGGFGFRLFDLATTLLKFMDEPDYDTLRAALLAGYTGLRPAEVDTLEFFLLLRSLTYVGWIADRLQEPGGDIRNADYVATARKLARRFCPASH